MATKITGTEGVDLIKDGTVKQADLADNVVGNGPAFRAYLSSGNQAVSSGALTKVLCTVESFDTHNNFDTTLSRFTPTVAGYYQIDANITMTGTTVTAQITRLLKNGTNISDAVLQYNMLGTTSSLGVHGLVFMNGTTDYIELFGQINGTANTAFVEGSYATWLSGFLARAA